MSYDPYFFIKTCEDGSISVNHNCDGKIGFMSTTEIDEETHRLILKAISEGERRKEKEIRKALGLK